jgi:hypothetical protein
MHIVLDNSSTHKTPKIGRWLAAHPRFHLHFTPTSSSWINLVERWFAELTNKKLRRSAHQSVRALNADIRSWIETWNQNPHPYVSTKTAERILESIASYCKRINPTQHYSPGCLDSSKTGTQGTKTRRSDWTEANVPAVASVCLVASADSPNGSLPGLGASA